MLYNVIDICFTVVFHYNLKERVKKDENEMVNYIMYLIY